MKQEFMFWKKTLFYRQCYASFCLFVLTENLKKLDQNLAGYQFRKILLKQAGLNDRNTSSVCAPQAADCDASQCGCMHIAHVVAGLIIA